MSISNHTEGSWTTSFIWLREIFSRMIHSLSEQGIIKWENKILEIRLESGPGTGAAKKAGSKEAARNYGGAKTGKK